MNRNPIVNALAAVGYIALVAAFISFGAPLFPKPANPLPDILAFLSVFVFSAAVMGYLVLGTPLQMFLEGQKKEAIAFFFKTLGAFAVIAAILFSVLLLLSF